MKIVFTIRGRKEYDHWIACDHKIFAKIEALIENIAQTPFSGLGKPERLKHRHSGKWSRRITDEHRLVYSVDNSTITIYQCRYHY